MIILIDLIFSELNYIKQYSKIHLPWIITCFFNFFYLAQKVYKLFEKFLFSRYYLAIDKLKVKFEYSFFISWICLITSCKMNTVKIYLL